MVGLCALAARLPVATGFVPQAPAVGSMPHASSDAMEICAPEVGCWCRCIGCVLLSGGSLAWCCTVVQCCVSCFAAVHCL